MRTKFLKLKNPFILAPMAGVNDLAFRLLCKKYRASLVSTEMVSANAILSGNKTALLALESCKQEKPVSLQIFGRDASMISDAAKMIEQNYDFDSIDINLGCPATKIMHNDSGAALLRDPKKISDIIFKTIGAVDIPITAKLRIGIDMNHINILENVKLIEKAGAAAIAIHARTATQGYAGKADWSWIKKAKDILDIPVIGNGDVTTPESALAMIKETRCDYVMIGRAVMGNPNLFKQCNDYLKKGSYEKNLDFRKLFLEYLELANDHGIDFRYVKVHANYFTKGIIGGARLRDNIARTKDFEGLKNLFL